MAYKFFLGSTLPTAWIMDGVEIAEKEVPSGLSTHFYH